MIIIKNKATLKIIDAILNLLIGIKITPIFLIKININRILNLIKAIIIKNYKMTIGLLEIKNLIIIK